MIATGLLWYDDDTHHSLARKLADAAERYRERVGFEPTSCQLNPALIPAAPTTVAAGGQTRRARARSSEPDIALRLIPDEHLRPNYFFVGVEAGEPALRVPGWRAEDDDEYDHAPRPATKSAKPQKPQIAAKTATASRTAPRSAGMAAAHSINIEKPAESATALNPGKIAGTKTSAESATAHARLSAHPVGALPAAPAAPETGFHSPAESATAIPGKNGNHHLPSPRGRGVGGEVIPPASRRPTLPSDSRQKRQPPRATSGKNGNHQSGSSELTAETATAIKPARAATTQKPAKSAITSVPRSTAPRSPRTGVAKATTPKSAAATVPASAPAKPKLRSHADATKPAKTATAHAAGKLTLISPQIAAKSKIATPLTQPTQPASSTTTRKARIAAKTATVISPSPLPHPSRSRKTTIAAESATLTPAEAPVPPTRARKAAKTATASQSETPETPALPRRARKPAGSPIAQHPAAREATTPRPSPRRRASRPEAIQARFQPPASTAANVATATKPSQQPRKPAKTATTPRTPVPAPAQATLWGDAPAPAHPIRKRRSA